MVPCVRHYKVIREEFNILNGFKCIIYVVLKPILKGYSVTRRVQP